MTNKPLPDIDATWTLFLDRDGVINYEKDNDYIHEWNEFVFYPGVKEALQKLSFIFPRIIVITNQRGVGKGLTKVDNLHIIHENMQKEVLSAGGRIDRVYYCPDLNNDSMNRKPQIGMAHQAQSDYPQIDFSRTIMVGNNISDMKFGRNIGAYNVFLRTTHPEQENDPVFMDISAVSLFEFSQLLVN